MKLLSFDPSGNMHEGKGTSGWALFQDGKLAEFGHISAKDYNIQETYWDAHSNLIAELHPDGVLIESYKLFEHKAQSQSWSEVETAQLIGYLKMTCFHLYIPVAFQDPQQKQGVNDERLVKLGYFEKRGNRYYVDGKLAIIHERDAIRHGIYYYRYGKGKTDEALNS